MQDRATVNPKIIHPVWEREKDPRAVAFDTDRYRKYQLHPVERWTRLFECGPNEELYVEKGCVPSSRFRLRARCRGWTGERVERMTR